MHPSFTILLTSKNSRHFIRESVASILKQTYLHFNVFIFDDNSTDGTLEWLMQLTDSRIKIYPSTSDLGIQANWARFATVSKNEFCTIMGHDDLLYPAFLETIAGLIQQYPEAALYHTHFDFIDADGKKIRHCKPMQALTPLHEFIRLFFTKKIDSMGTGYVMRSANYDATGGIPNFPNLLFADFALWIRLLQQGSLATTPDNCFAFRLHHSVTSASKDINMQEGFNLLLQQVHHIADGNPLVQQEVTAHGAFFLLTYTKSFAHRLLRTQKKERSMEVKDIVAASKMQADYLNIENYEPEKFWQIKIANAIDRSLVLSYIFCWYKKILPSYKLK